MLSFFLKSNIQAGNFQSAAVPGPDCNIFSRYKHITGHGYEKNFKDISSNVYFVNIPWYVYNVNILFTRLHA